MWLRAHAAAAMVDGRLRSGVNGAGEIATSGRSELPIKLRHVWVFAAQVVPACIDMDRHDGVFISLLATSGRSRLSEVLRPKKA